MDQLEKSSKKAEKQMKKSAAILPQVEGQGNPDYESKDEQKFAGDDTYTYGKKDDSPLNAYVSTAGHFQRLQDNIAAAFTPTKGAKTKAEKETEFKGETEKISENLEETTNKEFKGFKKDNSIIFLIYLLLPSLITFHCGLKNKLTKPWLTKNFIRKCVL